MSLKSISEVAMKTGLSYETVRKMFQNGTIPTIKAPKRRYCTDDELDKFLKGGASEKRARC